MIKQLKQTMLSLQCTLFYIYFI